MPKRQDYHSVDLTTWTAVKRNSRNAAIKQFKLRLPQGEFAHRLLVSESKELGP